MKTLVSDDFSYSGTFSLTDQTANGYPIWSREHPEGHMLYIYLHDNGYIHVYHESSGPDAAIWRQRVDATACPYDQGVDFGYWNGELAVADDTQVWMIPVRQVFQ